MKRYVVGTLLFSIVMFVQIFGDIPVFANTFVPTSSYEFTGLADLGYALVGGAEFDFDGSPYVIDNYNSLSAEQKEIEKSLAARQFLKDYMESRGIAFEENGELQKGPAYYTIAFGLAGQEFFEAFQTATAAEQEDLEYNMPISPSRFADWAQYNKYWFSRYADDFASESDEPTYNVPVQYQSYIDKMNGSGFYWKNYTSPLSGYDGNATFSGLTSDYSYIIRTPFGTSVIGSTSSGLVFPCYYITLNINYNGTNYTGTISGVNNKANFLYNQGFYWNALSYSSGNSYDNKINNGYNVSNYSYTYTNDLSSVLNYYSNRLRNVNVYVDGEPWAIVGNPAPANPVIPDFPDIINQETGELAYDIAMPKTQDYSGSFDLTSLFDAIREGIAGASDGDLATGSTIGSLDVGRTYTGEGIDIQDRVIDLTSSRVFDGTLTDNTTGRLPKPPVVPPAVNAGLGGVTVLAKFVDATQCILPEDLITAFWGCVWILIMLGLIKNLHR